MSEKTDRTNWGKIQWKIPERKGLTFIKQFIVLKSNISLFKALIKHKKPLTMNCKSETADIRHMKKQVKDKYQKVAIIFTCGTKNYT